MGLIHRCSKEIIVKQMVCLSSRDAWNKPASGKFVVKGDYVFL
jgi:hypothetical protein